jgi:hypothetical protein
MRFEDHAFACQILGPLDMGGQLDECAVGVGIDIGCAPGFVCLQGEVVPDCTSSFCCTTLCSLDGPSPCDESSLCAPYFVDDVPPGLEHVGACYIPQ